MIWILKILKNFFKILDNGIPMWYITIVNELQQRKGVKKNELHNSI